MYIKREHPSKDKDKLLDYYIEPPICIPSTLTSKIWVPPPPVQNYKT